MWTVLHDFPFNTTDIRRHSKRVMEWCVMFTVNVLYTMALSCGVLIIIVLGDIVLDRLFSGEFSLSSSRYPISSQPAAGGRIPPRKTA